jgi:FkbM family methyltransferase
MRNRTLNVVQNFFHRMGLHLSRYPLRSEYENVLHDFLVGFDVSCVLDVGANVGHYGAMLRRIGYGGRLVSFEPALATYQRLQQRATKYPPWEAHRTALGESNGNVSMHVFPGHENSTLAEVGKFGREWLPSAFRNERFENVPLRRLDSLIAEGVVDSSVPTLLKVDAEGYDWQVIDGAGERINDFVGLQTELMVQPVWEKTLPFGESVTRLASMGFKPVTFSVPNRAHLSAIVVDGLFRNTRFIPNAGHASRMWNPDGMGLHPQIWEDEGASANSFRDDAGASWKT